MPRDFFLNARYLFGFLAPGALWLCCVLLGVGIDVGGYFATMSFAQAALFLAASFVVGHTAAALTFPLGVKASERLERHVRFRHRDSVEADRRHETALTAHVRRVLDDRYGDDEYLGGLSNDALPRLCKRALLEGSTRYAQQLDEAEAEINLRTGFSSPIFVFGLLFAIRGWPAPVMVGLGAALILSAIVLVSEVASMRRGERRMWCEMFLIAHLAHDIRTQGGSS